MVEWFTSTAGSGSLVLAIPVALIAGLVAFFSPCVLPLLPAYFSYATGLSGADLATGDLSGARRGRMLAGSVLFVLGFSVVFVLIGTASGALGAWLISYRRELAIVLGLLAIVLGLIFAGFLPLLQRDWRVHKVPAVGVGAAPLLGFLFGVGWTPCISPTLGVISTLAINEGTAARGALLSGVFALGIGLPFILLGLAYRRMLGAIGVIRRHQRLLNVTGGVLLIIVGLLLVSGWWDHAVTWMQIRLADYNEVLL
ncbi:cytochrome c biogenesis CcdA family protein [Nocardioides limicola]|uniref:cytochrome c biogenesis CcdA family protein n=1 Tax=Nocardioides limicola TaxID=2803368 RepID=UPI00193B8D42|nr:cytochrome c biogenesis protein CcdA [Nocardioides sp. DJM-14]